MRDFIVTVGLFEGLSIDEIVFVWFCVYFLHQDVFLPFFGIALGEDLEDLLVEEVVASSLAVGLENVPWFVFLYLLQKDLKLLFAHLVEFPLFGYWQFQKFPLLFCQVFAENMLLRKFGLHSLAVEEFHCDSGNLDSVAELDLLSDVPNGIPILFVVRNTIACPEVCDCHFLATQTELIICISSQLSGGFDQSDPSWFDSFFQQAKFDESLLADIGLITLDQKEKYALQFLLSIKHCNRVNQFLGGFILDVFVSIFSVK